MKALLLALAVWLWAGDALAVCADDEDPQDQIDEVTASYNALSVPLKAKVADYYALWLTEPDVALAMDFCNLGTTVRSYIWLAFEEAIDNNGVLDSGVPACYPEDPSEPTDIWTCALTNLEASHWFAEKVAHQFWLEDNTVWPWRWSRLDLDMFRGLFDPDQLLELRTMSFPTAVEMNVVDYSVPDTYGVSQPIVAGKTTEYDAAEAIFTWFSDNIMHWTTADTPSRGPAEVSYTAMDGWSRSGCHSACDLLSALLRSVGIPSRSVYGYMFANNHRTCIYPSLGLVLGHGDDIYSGFSSPVMTRFHDLACWNAEIFSLPPYGEPGFDEDEMAKLTNRQLYLKWMQFPPHSWSRGYDTTPGWFDYFTAQWSQYFEPCESWRLDNLEQKLKNRVGDPP